MQYYNIYDSFTQFQDGFNYEQARLEEDAVMQQKYKVLSFAIVAAYTYSCSINQSCKF